MKKFLYFAFGILLGFSAFSAPTGYTYAGKLKNGTLVCTNAVQAVGGGITPILQEKKWAMFVIKVNATTNLVYTGFELKATTNNFIHAGTANGTLFYSQSAIASTGVAGESDKMRLFVCTKFYGATDARSYYKINDTGPISKSGVMTRYHFTDIVVLVSVDCLIRAPDGAWLSDQNENLIWCYCRTCGVDAHEVDMDGTTGLWRPIAPVKWLSKLPDWANQNF